MLKTEIKDSYDKDIYYNDIVSVGGRFGWIFKYDKEPYIGWDVEGPSCEDCISLKDQLKDKYSAIKVIGVIKIK